jgi:hypothetical protein
MVHIKQGSKRLSPLNAKSLTHNFAFALLCWLARRWSEDRAYVGWGKPLGAKRQAKTTNATRNPAIKC